MDDYIYNLSVYTYHEIKNFTLNLLFGILVTCHYACVGI